MKVGKRRRWVWLVVGLLLIAAAYGGWRLCQPAPYRLVARIPLAKYASEYGDSGLAGLCLQENSGMYALHDWHTGAVIWRVKAAPCVSAFGPLYVEDLSPDGRVIAVASPAGAAARLQTWRDGKLIGDITIPNPRTVDPAARWWLAQGCPYWLEPDVTVLDSGECFLTLSPTSEGSGISVDMFIYKIKNGRIMGPEYQADGQSLAEDGKMLLGIDTSAYIYRLYNIETRRGGLLHFSLARKLTPMRNFSLLNGGLAIDEEWKEAYFSSGKHLVLPAGWKFSYGALMDGRHLLAYQDNGNQVRIIDTVQELQWKLSLKSKLNDLTLSFDGQHIVGIEETKDKYSRLQAVLKRITPTSISDRYFSRYPRYLVIYDRNGKCLTRTLLKDDLNSPILYPSPDGSAVYMFTEGNEFLLYRR